MPFALAAKAVNPTKPVIAIVGDSAFGFRFVTFNISHQK